MTRNSVQIFCCVQNFDDPNVEVRRTALGEPRKACGPFRYAVRTICFIFACLSQSIEHRAKNQPLHFCAAPVGHWLCAKQTSARSNVSSVEKTEKTPCYCSKKQILLAGMFLSHVFIQVSSGSELSSETAEFCCVWSLRGEYQKYLPLCCSTLLRSGFVLVHQSIVLCSPERFER